MADKHKVVVIGAGPVGSLAALYAANRGDEVHIYDLREDLRNPSTTPLNFTRSINLALSERGVNSIRQSGNDELLHNVVRDTIPMYGRMIHGRSKDGSLFEESQAYDAHGRCIQAVDRSGLNKALLDALEELPNVTFHFNHKLTGADFNRRVAWFEQYAQTWLNPNVNFPPNVQPKPVHMRPVEVEVDFDFLIGADGAHSAARYHMMKYARVTYDQEYIDTLWCEFQIKPRHFSTLDTEKDNRNFAISPNHLHIWPAGSSMFIAIPSIDRSFTCTLFAPSDHFDSISRASSTDLYTYFHTHFPGVCPNLITICDLQSQYESNPHLPLISIKCKPHHYKSSVVIVGDAAHAMVPFYGQGMNAGLEDIRVLFEFLDQHVYNKPHRSKLDRDCAREDALEAYTTQRAPDAAAISDLAMGNYKEMRSSVRSPVYKLKKRLDELLFLYAPGLGWRPQYPRVSFENQRYSDVVKEVQWQGQVLLGVIGTVGAVTCAVGMFILARFLL